MTTAETFDHSDRRQDLREERWRSSPQISLWQIAAGWWRSISRLRRSRPKRLRLCESLPLGEHRFVAVVEFEQSRYLIGGTQGSLVLLSSLPGPGGIEGREKENQRQVSAAPEVRT